MIILSGPYLSDIPFMVGLVLVPYLILIYLLTKIPFTKRWINNNRRLKNILLGVLGFIVYLAIISFNIWKTTVIKPKSQPIKTVTEVNVKQEIRCLTAPKRQIGRPVVNLKG